MPKNLVYSDETINKYLKKNNLQDSYIPARLLFQVRNTLPMRIFIGNINGTGKLFFEETGEVYDTADVYINCKNCATIHFLDNHIKAESEG